MPHKVLILDDDSHILFFCSYLFENMGFEVRTSTHCKDIFEQVQEYQPEVLMIDNRIPDIGGIKAIQLLKGHPQYKDIPIIFFSANSDLPSLAKEAGADYYLRKPFEIADVENLVAGIFANRENTDQT